jgi:hypothetical protein
LYTPLAQNPDELHAAQGPPFGPSYPKSHTQAVTRDMPSPQCEFDGQATQSDTAVLPTDPWYVLLGQLAHVDARVAPTAPEYVPTPHCAHTDAPVETWYDPAAHSAQYDIPLAAANFPASHPTHASSAVDPA